MIADKIMSWCWGYKQWDNPCPAYRWWKQQVKKKKRSILWWKKNYKRIWDA